MDDIVHPHTTSCTDTIPLLCSVTTPPSNKRFLNDLYADGTTLAQQQFQLHQEINSWETSMENVNLECISTISN